MEIFQTELNKSPSNRGFVRNTWAPRWNTRLDSWTVSCCFCFTEPNHNRHKFGRQKKVVNFIGFEKYFAIRGNFEFKFLGIQILGWFDWFDKSIESPGEEHWITWGNQLNHLGNQLNHLGKNIAFFGIQPSSTQQIEGRLYFKTGPGSWRESSCWRWRAKKATKSFAFAGFATEYLTFGFSSSQISWKWINQWNYG